MADSPVDLESELERQALAEVVAEALRAGPGTPAWRAALGQTEMGSVDATEQLRLLRLVRQRLEQGRSWRAVTAGPDFTAGVMRGIDEHEAAGKQRSFLARWILGACVAVLMAMGVWLAASGRLQSLMPGGGSAGQVDQVFGVTPIFLWQAGDKLDEEMARRAGGATLSIGSDGIRLPLAKGAVDVSDDVGAVLLLEKRLDPLRAVALDVDVVRPTGEKGYVEVVVAAADATDGTLRLPGDHGISAHEFTVTVGRKSLMVDDATKHVVEVKLPVEKTTGPLRVRIVIGADENALIVDGQTVWRGGNGLGNRMVRYVGLRFTGTGEAAGASGAVTRMALYTPVLR